MRRLFNKTKNALRLVRHARVRAIIVGTATRPRLSVFRSLRGMNLQLIDDSTHRTLCSVNKTEIKGKKAEGKTTKVAEAYLMGQLIGEKAKALGIKTVVFDRGGYDYHGRVAAAAEGARASGLEF